MGEIEKELAGTHPLVRKQITCRIFDAPSKKNLYSRLVKYLPVLIEMTMGLTSAAQACFAGLEEEVEENDLEKIQFLRFLHPRLDYHHHPPKSLVL